jgi:hypothetical protein
MEDRFSFRIFFILGIANLFLASIFLIGSIVILFMSGPGGAIFLVLMLATINFCQIAFLAGHLYWAMRAVNERFRNLQESLGRREELPAK